MGASASQQTASGFFAITPSDAADVALPNSIATCRALYFDVGGTVSLDDWYGNTSVSFAVSDGQILLVQPKRVRSTGTTATGIKGLA